MFIVLEILSSALLWECDVPREFTSRKTGQRSKFKTSNLHRTPKGVPGYYPSRSINIPLLLE